MRESSATRSQWRWPIRIGATLAALGLIWFLTGWTPLATLAARLTISAESVIPELAPDEEYEAVIPYYAEICATSQWRKQVGGGGNPFGHAIIYLKGACVDEEAPFPQLRRCASVAETSTDPEHGAGVSVGRFFRNVNWIAVPGRALTFEGLVAPDERLTQERLDETVQHAIDAGLFRGVELHAPYSAATREDLAAYIGSHSVGTDFALRYARNVFCARVPIPEPALEEAIAFLNDKNREYAEGEADYNWSLFNHNCVHTVRNALAAANFWGPISVGEVKLRALFNLAVPANEFVNLALLGADGPLSAPQVARDRHVRDALHEWGWTPTRHGAVVKFLPAIRDNALFVPDFQLFAVQSLLWMPATQATMALMEEPRHVDLETNLRWFIDRYAAEEARHEAVRDPLASVRGDAERRLSRLHLDHIRAQRADAEAMLAEVVSLKAAHAQAGP
ncbi:MAG: hypothetical protein ACFCUS_06560 [Rubrimonas sp.]|uniref:hypothetical protein n=1 Tax=Rubrimonas sp. TaxID=2036015 RepID=UPI002FDDC0E8